MKERREREGDSSELSASILDPFHGFAMQRLPPCDQSLAHKEHNGADCAAALRSRFTTKVKLASRLEKMSNWKKKKETNLVLFHLSGDYWQKTTLKSARVSISRPKEKEGEKNEKREEPKSNASSQEVLIILTPCGRTDKDIKTEQTSQLLLLLYESCPALHFTGTWSH